MQRYSVCTEMIYYLFSNVKKYAKLKVENESAENNMRTPLKKCSLTADDGASPALEWCTASAEMVHGGRGRGAPGRHAGDYSGMPLRLR
ncbi:hypothetical protein, partial [Flavonifractor sp. An306]|uniref:hypothetical protein n=1 Tax=Flavonifractor sp. An306 TaxID=1965629 RepID=UPI0019500A4A